MKVLWIPSGFKELWSEPPGPVEATNIDRAVEGLVLGRDQVIAIFPRRVSPWIMVLYSLFLKQIKVKCLFFGGGVGVDM